MIEVPPVPSWDALHPLIIHFPIALLLVVPVLIVVGLVARAEKGRGWFLAALLLMVLGTASTYVAVATGEAAGQLADRTPAVSALLEHHEELAETVRLSFTVLTVVFAAILFVPTLLRRQLRRATAAALTVVFLGFYGAGALLLANTGHAGARLVHEQGVTALMPAAPLPAGEVAHRHADGDD
jgi:uncharacterized membrane protein